MANSASIIAAGCRYGSATMAANMWQTGTEFSTLDK